MMPLGRASDAVYTRLKRGRLSTSDTLTCVRLPDCSPPPTPSRLDGSSSPTTYTVAFGWQFVADQLHGRVWMAVRRRSAPRSRLDGSSWAIGLAVAFGR